MVGTDNRTVGLFGFRIWWIMMEDMAMPSSWKRDGHDVTAERLPENHFLYLF